MRKHPDFRTEQRKQKIRQVLEKRQKSLTVIMENINDPHNLSACLRSCDAVGIQKAYTIYFGSQPIPKLGKQSSASAKKWVSLEMFHSIEKCFNIIRQQGMKIYTTHLSRDAKPIYDIDLTKPVALMFGNEHQGVSEEAAELADGNIIIPQIGMIQSLNISVACAVSVFEAFRQRLKAGMYNVPQFPKEELELLIREWLMK